MRKYYEVNGTLLIELICPLLSKYTFYVYFQR